MARVSQIPSDHTRGGIRRVSNVRGDRVFRLNRQGVTFVLATSYMDEAEQLCDRLVVMDRGSIAEEGAPLELIRRLSTREVVELRFPDGVPEVDPTIFDGQMARIEVLPDRLLLYTDDGDALVPTAH